MQANKILLITACVFLFNCHTLTIINDIPANSANNQENVEQSFSLTSEQSVFTEEAHVYHLYTGFFDMSKTVENKCAMIKTNWERIYIYRDKVNASLETAADAFLFFPFGRISIIPSLLAQTVEGSPIIYKNTSVKFTCHGL